jgi:hypothetical protein
MIYVLLRNYDNTFSNKSSFYAASPSYLNSYIVFPSHQYIYICIYIYMYIYICIYIYVYIYIYIYIYIYVYIYIYIGWLAAWFWIWWIKQMTCHKYVETFWLTRWEAHLNCFVANTMKRPPCETNLRCC